MFRLFIMDEVERFEDIEWCYMAEGNANIIVKGQNSKIVARLRKQQNNNIKEKCCKEIIHQKTPNKFSFYQEKMFLDCVIRFLINSCYLVDVKIIEVSEYFLLKLKSNIEKDRPQYRLHKDLNVKQRFIQLLPNLSYLPSSNTYAKCISVEIKPKCGLMPENNNIHNLKKKVCRFCMQQVTKLKIGKTSQISSYCPLDLFSNCTCRVRNALNCLLMTPQNNLLVTVDGEKYPMSDIQEFNVGIISSLELLVSVLMTIFLNDACEVELVLNIFCSISQKFCENRKHNKHLENCQSMGHGGILNALRSLQMLDYMDIENIHNLFQLYSKQDVFEKDFSSEFWQNIVKEIKSRMKVNDLTTICQYLISSTFKDCSLFITFTNLPHSGCATDLPVVFHKETESWFEYQIKIVDLEPRCAHNIPFYYYLDQDIIANYIASKKITSVNNL